MPALPFLNDPMLAFLIMDDYWCLWIIILRLLEWTSASAATLQRQKTCSSRPISRRKSNWSWSCSTDKQSRSMRGSSKPTTNSSKCWEGLKPWSCSPKKTTSASTPTPKSLCWSWKSPSTRTPCWKSSWSSWRRREGRGSARTPGGSHEAPRISGRTEVETGEEGVWGLVGRTGGGNEGRRGE